MVGKVKMRNRRTIIIIGSILVIMYLLSHLQDYPINK